MSAASIDNTAPGLSPNGLPPAPQAYAQPYVPEPPNRNNSLLFAVGMCIFGFLANAFVNSLVEGNKSVGGTAIDNTTRLTALETKVTGMESTILEKLGSMQTDITGIRSNMKTVLTADDAQNMRQLISDVERDLQRQVDGFRTEQKARIKQIENLSQTSRDQRHKIMTLREDVKEVEERLANLLTTKK